MCNVAQHLDCRYFLKGSQVSTAELHGFCDTSGGAFAAIIYHQPVELNGRVPISRHVQDKSKRSTIPRLELCGAYLLAYYVKEVMGVKPRHCSVW